MSKKSFLTNAIGILFLLMLSFFAGIVTFTFFYFDPLENIREKNTDTSTVIVFDKKGEKISFDTKKEYSTYIYFYQMPPHLINAFLAREDTQFFKHNGISFSGIMRSIIVNIMRKKFAQGASTITQQMIKLHMNDLQKTLRRKIKEQVYALCTELHHSKEEILEYYLNILYFGSGIYGIEHASKTFWNKHCYELSLAQAATLAGIIQRPESFNPYKNYDACVKKRNIVLKKMHDSKYITLSEYENALKEPLIINSYHKEITTNNINILTSSYTKNRYLSHQKQFIYTTCDYAIQKKMNILFEKYLNNLRKTVPNIQGASILLNHRTGEIIAICNGCELYKNNMPRALLNRQIGSTIKPFVLYYAFAQGDTPETIYIDEPITNVQGWNPRNFNYKFLGEMPLNEALIRSNNTIPIKILQKYGITDFILFLKNFFPHDKYIPPYLSLALGTIECSTLEMAYSIGTLKNNGIGITPYWIKIAYDVNGNILEKNIIEKKIIGETHHLNQLLPILENIGTQLCNRLNIKKPKGLIGKTGTTNDSKTCWFIGADNTYAIATWFGTDNNISLAPYKISSISTAAHFSIEFLNEITQ